MSRWIFRSEMVLRCWAECLFVVGLVVGENFREASQYGTSLLSDNNNNKKYKEKNNNRKSRAC